VPVYATHAPPVEESTTGNGVQVVTESTFSGEGAVTVSVKVKAGSRYEHSHVNGIAAFAAAASLDTVAADAAKIGAFGVCTDREVSTFTATVMGKDVPKAMELLGKAVAADVKECDSEARAGLAECHAMDFRTNLMDHLHEAAFLSTPLAMAPMGTGSSVAGISAPDLNAFKDTNFTTDGICVSVAGAGVDHGIVAGLVEKSMGARAESSSSLATPTKSAVFTGSDKRIRFDSHPDALVSLAFQGASNGTAEWFPFKVMTHILGDWSESSPIGANSSTK